MDAESQLLAEKDAEIARLRVQVKELSEAYQKAIGPIRPAEKDAEIERLKGENDLLLIKVGCLESLRSKDKTIITELADELDSWTGWLDKRDTKAQQQLIQRGREATR